MTPKQATMPAINGRNRTSARDTSGINTSPANRPRKKAICSGDRCGSCRPSGVGSSSNRMKKLLLLQSTAARTSQRRAERTPVSWV